MSVRKSYPSDVSDDEWAFVAPYLALIDEHALQRKYDLREVYNGLRWLVRTGAQWRMLPHDFPRWEAVYQQTQRWLRAGCFKAMADDLRLLLRLAAGREGQPSTVILDARTVQSTPESGANSGYDGHKRRKGRKVHLAVDTLGHLLATVVTPANDQERARGGRTWRRWSRRRPAKRSNWPMSTKATPERKQRRPQPPRASSWKWSNCQTPTGPSVALSCCRGAGWSSAASPGSPAFVAWRATTSGCLRRWRG